MPWCHQKPVSEWLSLTAFPMGTVDKEPGHQKLWYWPNVILEYFGFNSTRVNNSNKSTFKLNVKVMTKKEFLLDHVSGEAVLATDLTHARKVVDTLIGLQLRDSLRWHKTVIPDQVTETNPSEMVYNAFMMLLVTWYYDNLVHAGHHFLSYVHNVVCVKELYKMQIQCGTVIKQSLFSQILTTDTP